MTADAVETWVNGRWPLLLPPHRAARDSWPWWEATRLAAMRHFINEGDMVLDVGAEEGDFPALFSMWGADVFLVEPNPKVWPNIRYIWEANGLRHPAGWFVGFCSDAASKPTRSDTLRPRLGFEDWPQCAYGPVIGDHGFRHLAEETDTTEATTIDVLAASMHRKIDVITMDIEGAELKALQGARRTLTHDRPMVFVSVHVDPLRDFYGSTPETLWDHMANCDYERVFLTYDHESHEMFVPRERMWPR